MKRILIMVAAMWTLLAAMAAPVSAAEADSAVAGTVLKTDADVEVHQSASDSSKVITVSSVFCFGV